MGNAIEKGGKTLQRMSNTQRDARVIFETAFELSRNYGENQNKKGPYTPPGHGTIFVLKHPIDVPSGPLRTIPVAVNVYSATSFFGKPTDTEIRVEGFGSLLVSKKGKGLKAEHRPWEGKKVRITGAKTDDLQIVNDYLNALNQIESEVEGWQQALATENSYY